MQDHEAIEMMARCREEIRSLRREVERLEPKAAAYDAISQILGLLPRTSGGAVPDMVWMLDKRIDELKQVIAAQAQASVATPAAEA